MIKSVIFDFSGVLSNDIESTYRAVMDIFKFRGLEQISIEKFKEAYDLPWGKFYSNLNLKEVDMDEEVNLFKKLFPKYVKLAVPMEGAKETLEKLKEKDIKIIILTSRNSNSVLSEIKSNGFEGLIDGVETSVIDKTKVINGLLKKHGIENNSTLYVGDLPHDIDTAKCAGIKSVAMLGGFGKKEELLAKKPDYCIENTFELIPLINTK